MRKLSSMLSWKAAKKLVITVIGSTVVLLGLIMMVTPGPGLAVLLGGLAILATEFIWARRLLKQVKQKTTDAVTRARNGFRRATHQPDAGADDADPSEPSPEDATAERDEHESCDPTARAKHDSDQPR